MTICAVVGGQFGSEGKGLIVGHIAKDYCHHVRVGAANAGHTLYTEAKRADHLDASSEVRMGQMLFEKHVMQQVPCAAYANPYAELYIGPGALLTPEIMERELRLNDAWRKPRALGPAHVHIDKRAQVIQPGHIRFEQESGLAERIGSTSTIAREGIGAAQAARVMRDSGCVTAEEYFEGRENEFLTLCDVPDLLNHDDTESEGILLEGTQGAGLSLQTGFFPYVTSRNTTASGLLADCGMPPNADAIILVCRTYPIRVAGPSGPFYEDGREITWDEIGVNQENERTTVTKKIRRVANFSLKQVVDAARINGATEIAVTFCDYLDPTIAGKSGSIFYEDLRKQHPVIWSFIETISIATGVVVTMLGTGPHSVLTVD